MKPELKDADDFWLADLLNDVEDIHSDEISSAVFSDNVMTRISEKQSRYRVLKRVAIVAAILGWCTIWVLTGGLNEGNVNAYLSALSGDEWLTIGGVIAIAGLFWLVDSRSRA